MSMLDHVKKNHIFSTPSHTLNGKRLTREAHGNWDDWGTAGSYITSQTCSRNSIGITQIMKDILPPPILLSFFLITSIIKCAYGNKQLKCNTLEKISCSYTQGRGHRHSCLFLFHTGIIINSSQEGHLCSKRKHTAEKIYTVLVCEYEYVLYIF